MTKAVLMRTPRGFAARHAASAWLRTASPRGRYAWHKGRESKLPDTMAKSLRSDGALHSLVEQRSPDQAFIRQIGAS
jgi:hypothetical protein